MDSHIHARRATTAQLTARGGATAPEPGASRPDHRGRRPAVVQAIAPGLRRALADAARAWALAAGVPPDPGTWPAPAPRGSGRRQGAWPGGVQPSRDPDGRRGHVAGHPGPGTRAA